MKKVSAIILCCLLVVVLLAMPVLAAQTATFTVTSSANTAERGDVIVVTVSMTEVKKAYNGAFVFDFDTDVFEYLEEYDDPTTGDTIYSEADVNGATAGVSVAAGKVTGWFMNGKKNVEGDVFYVILKVKDTAPIGATQITGGSVSVESKDDGMVTCSVNGTTVSITCDHDYGSWTADGAENHKRTCTKCGTPETQAHDYGTWSTTTPAGCDTAGEKTRTCAVCGDEDTASVEATGNHTFTGAWTKVDETNHKRTCSTCQDGTPEVQTQAHEHENWTVTTNPGCDTAGVETGTCVCGDTDTRSVNATGNHIYGAWVKVDDTNHKRTCTTCQDGTPATETMTHTWGTWSVTDEPDCANPGEKERTCTAGCGAKQTEPVPSTGEHGYNTWTKVDEEYHTAVCSGCGAAPKTDKHTWDNGTVTTPAGCDKDGVKTYTCTAAGCGDTKEEPIPATGNHIWGEWTKVDATNHARTCTTCQDGTPETQTEAHNPSIDMYSDATNHWNVCFCGEKMNVTVHVYDQLIGDAAGHVEGCECGTVKPGATKVSHNFDEGVVTKKPTTKKEGEKTFTCTDCGYKHVEPIDKVTTPNTGDETLVIPMVILAVLSACGLAVTVIARKRASR